jgi:copper homeostasis protein
VSLLRAGLIAMTRKRVTIGLHVLIRPRAGDFCYSADEFEVMKRDVLLANWVPIGVVFGILDADANVDGERSRQLVALAPPLAVPFHRAFDRVRDPAPPWKGS